MKIFSNVLLIINQRINNIDNRRNLIYFITFSFINFSIFTFILYIKISEEKEERKNNNYIKNDIDLIKERYNIIKRNKFRFLKNLSKNNQENNSSFITNNNYKFIQFSLFINSTKGWPNNMTKEQYLLNLQKEILLTRMTFYNYKGKIKYIFDESNTTEKNISKFNESLNLKLNKNITEINDENIDFFFNFMTYKDNITKIKYFVLKGNYSIDKEKYSVYRYFFKNITIIDFQIEF